MNFHHNSKNENRKNLNYDFSFSSYGENSYKFTSLQPPLNALTELGTHSSASVGGKDIEQKGLTKMR